MVPLEFWKAARTELDKVKAVFMLAEAEGPDLHEAFDMTYSWELLHLMNDVAQEKKGAQSLRDYFEKEKNKYPVDAYRMRFTTNHDENSWNGTVFERMGEAVETFDAFTCVIRGMPLVYSGQEAGLNKRLNFFDKDTIEWKDSKYRILYSGLLHEKEKNKALWNGEEGGGMIPVEASSGDVIAFVRQKDNDKMYAVFNLSSKSVKTELESNLIRGEYINLLSGKETKIKSREWIELKPWTYRILITK